MELLGPEYTSLPYKVYVYCDRKEVQTELDANPDMSAEEYDYILNNVTYRPPGVCLHKMKLIKLFPFNLDPSNPEMKKLHSVGNAFHELRHAWQQMNGLYLEEAEQKLDSDHIVDYLRRPSEKDAYAFQEEQMNNHEITISSILGFPDKGFNYTCDIEAIIRKIKRRSGGTRE